MLNIAAKHIGRASYVIIDDRRPYLKQRASWTADDHKRPRGYLWYDGQSKLMWSMHAYTAATPVPLHEGPHDGGPAHSQRTAGRAARGRIPT